MHCGHDHDAANEEFRRAIARPPEERAPTKALPSTEEVERTMKDAARYRWLRDVSVPPHNFYLSVPDEFKDDRYTPQQVDAAIDAAIGSVPSPLAPGDGGGR